MGCGLKFGRLIGVNAMNVLVETAWWILAGLDLGLSPASVDGMTVSHVSIQHAVRGTCLGNPIIRTLVSWGFISGSPILGNYHM